LLLCGYWWSFATFSLLQTNRDLLRSGPFASPSDPSYRMIQNHQFGTFTEICPFSKSDLSVSLRIWSTRNEFPVALRLVFSFPDFFIVNYYSANSILPLQYHESLVICYIYLGIASTWIDLDSNDESLGRDSECILKQEINIFGVLSQLSGIIKLHYISVCILSFLLTFIDMSGFTHIDLVSSIAPTRLKMRILIS
jgi:hypothetical protein